MENHYESEYLRYSRILANHSYPLAALELSFLKENIEQTLKRSGNKKIRIASKSIRCTEVMKMVLDYDVQFQGIMAYHGLEAVKLSQSGFDDILLGYPIVDTNILYEIAQELKKGKFICLMTDSKEHLELIEEAGRKMKVKFPVCVEIDLSKNYPGLRFGVWRSGIDNKESLGSYLRSLESKEHIKLCGLMGYEAQIAGLGDHSGGNFFTNKIIQQLKKWSVKHVKTWRTEALELIEQKGIKLQFVNGGGTGSLETTIEEERVTEVTVGSGFYCSHLFDKYNNFQLKPALFYGVQIVRRATSDILTAHGGGFIASGEPAPIKAPEIYLPQIVQLMANEGAGEVQTPLKVTELHKFGFDIGSPVYLRHAKAGELCERFNKIIFIHEDEKLSEALTYRGMGWSFG